MKDYYKILEVNKSASPEVIEKVYKVLAKKYHPDVQKSENVVDAEKKFKEIGEAYEILSNTEKRKEYDAQYENAFFVNIEDYQELLSYSKKLESSLNDYIIKSQSNHSGIQSNNYSSSQFTNASSNYQNNTTYQHQQERAYRDAMNKAYHDAYISSLKNMGYKIKYKKTFREYIHNLAALLLTALILSILFYIAWHIPSFKNYLINYFSF